MLTRLAQAGLIIAMILGSLLLWAGLPLGWLWIGSQLQSSTQQTSMGPYVLALVGAVVSIIVVGKAVMKLNDLYARVSGSEGTVRLAVPWQRSRDDAREGGREVGVLDAIMVATVIAALIAFNIWFLFFSGSPIDLRSGRH
jgi:hypothetical protein